MMLRLLARMEELLFLSFDGESALLWRQRGKLLESCSIPHKVNGYEYEAMEVNRCLRDGKLEVILFL